MSWAKEDFEELVRKRDEMDAIYSKDCWKWLCDLVWTSDEAEVAEAGLRAARRFPWPADKTYLRDVIDVLNNEPMVVIPKSRRMMISWLMAAYFVWYARYHANSALFWQSETEKKAAYIVDKRCHYIETHLTFRDFEPAKEFMQTVTTIKTKDSLIGQMTYPNESYIWAVAQGGDVLRTYTATKVVMDECEFQPQAPDAVCALLPLIEKGAQAILVSSSNGPIGVIAEICRDIGFTSWKDMTRLVKNAA